VGLDEKSQIQGLERTAPLLPMRPGQANDAPTTICGTAPPASSPHSIPRPARSSATQRRHRSLEFRKFIDTIEANVPAELDVHLVMDNYATHKTPSIQRWMVRPCASMSTSPPPPASWLSQVERFFAALTEKQIRRNSFRSTRQLEAALRDYLDHHNAQPKPFLWTKSADDILNALAKYCERINDSGH